MDSKKCYYKILGIEKTATLKDIKKAYKKLAIIYHPDKSKEEHKIENEEKFKEINESYSVLSDNDKRINYDKFGLNGENMNNMNNPFENVNMNDMFSQMFGQNNPFMNGQPGVNTIFMNGPPGVNPFMNGQQPGVNTVFMNGPPGQQPGVNTVFMNGPPGVNPFMNGPPGVNPFVFMNIHVNQ